MLLHGWTASADANFGPWYGPLAEQYRVLAYDQRGHGRGLRTRRPFRLADCADDAAAIASAMGAARFIAVGYSMGGAIAQLVARRHTGRVSGLVLCATAARFAARATRAARTIGFGGGAALARVTPSTARRWLTDRFYLDRKRGYWDPWVIEAAAGHDWRSMLEAGTALSTFRSASWVGGLGVPTAVVIPTRDHVVPPSWQFELAAAIPDARVLTVDGDHLAATASPEFVPALLAALSSVTRRAATTGERS